jgi:putative addiction module killer protein
MRYELRKTDIFDRWFSKLKDRSAKIKILARLDRVENGNFGDYKQIDKNLFELRIFFGPGYRIYYTIRGNTIVILLTGGKKATQSKDIEKAKALLNELED